jgi:hypothetical protein
LFIPESARNDLVPLAVIIAGAVSRSLGAAEDAARCRELVRRRERQVERWEK